MKRNVKRLVKRTVPRSIINLAMRFQENYLVRHRPHFRSFRGSSDTVLQCCIAYNKYGGYCVPLSSHYRPAAQKILSGSVYEAQTIEFLTSNCGDGDIVHAGTFFGDFLPALSRSVAVGRKVWAFESNPENYLCAFITKHINRLQNVELTNAGLGEQHGHASMMTSDQEGRALGGSSRIVAESNNGKNLQLVEIVAIDEIVPVNRTVSIIQLDVENFERQALTGALKTIQRCSPILVLENLPDENWLSENILQLGYRISGQVVYNTILVKGNLASSIAT